MAKTLKQKDINLLVALEKGGSSSADAQKRKKILIVLLAVVVLIAAAAGFYFFQVMGLNNEKEEMLAYIEDPTVISAYSQAQAKETEVKTMEENANWLQDLLMTLDGYPKMNAKKFSQVYGYAGGRIAITGVEYESSTATLIFSAEGDSATSVPIFVAQLRMSGIFDDVAYEGYANAQETEILGTTVAPDGSVVENTNVTNKYVFNVSCQVKAGE